MKERKRIIYKKFIPKDCKRVLSIDPGRRACAFVDMSINDHDFIVNSNYTIDFLCENRDCLNTIRKAMGYMFRKHNKYLSSFDLVIVEYQMSRSMMNVFVMNFIESFYSLHQIPIYRVYSYDKYKHFGVSMPVGPKNKNKRKKNVYDFVMSEIKDRPYRFSKRFLGGLSKVFSKDIHVCDALMQCMCFLEEQSVINQIV